MTKIQKALLLLAAGLGLAACTSETVYTPAPTTTTTTVRRTTVSEPVVPSTRTETQTTVVPSY